MECVHAFGRGNVVTAHTGFFAYGDRSTGRWVQGFESGGTGAMMGLLGMSFLDGSRRFALEGLVGQ